MSEQGEWAGGEQGGHTPNPVTDFFSENAKDGEMISGQPIERGPDMTEEELKELHDDEAREACGYVPLVESTSYHSYPKIYNMGHRAVATLFDGAVHVQEKVDGSQFSFGVFDNIIKCRSRNKQINIDAPDKMFKKGVETVLRLAHEEKLVDGWTYRGEYLNTPSHNTLEYDRVPEGNVILFDINTGEEAYLEHRLLQEQADRLGLELCPTIFFGKVSSAIALETLLDRISILGKAKIEGIVIKNYEQFGSDKKVLMGKFVSPEFKEKHQGEWKAKNPSQKDVIFNLAQTYKHENRWKKALQRLRDAGELTGTPKDIGALCKAVPLDIREECEGEIKDALFRWAWGTISKSSVAGLAEWYKDILVSKQFEEGVNT